MWSRRDDKLLELLLILYFPRWDIIAYNLVGGNKTPKEGCRRYESLLDEVTRVLQGLEVDTPREWDAQQIAVAASSPAPEREAAVAPAVATVADVVTVASLPPAGEEAATAAPVAEEKKDLVPTPSPEADGEASSGDAEKKAQRKKPEKWTKEEHYLFLEGLEKYGKGKWKEMSTELLPSKTSTQIASHHQKYSKRLEQRMRDGCKRASIHDITALPTTTTLEKAASQPRHRTIKNSESKRRR